MNFSQGEYCSFILLFFKKSLSGRFFVVVTYWKDNTSWASILGDDWSSKNVLSFTKLKTKNKIDLECLQVFAIQRTGHGRERNPEISPEAGHQQTHGQ